MSTVFFRSIRALEADNARRPWLALLLAAMLLAAWTAWFCLARVAIYEVSDKADIEVDRAAHPVEAQFTGRVVSSQLALDREVHAGEGLVELDADAQHFQLKEERTRLAALAPQVSALEGEIATEEKAWQQEQQASKVGLDESLARSRESEAGALLAEDEARREEQLFSSGVISEVDLRRARAAAQERRAAAESLQLGTSRLERQQRTQESERQARIQEIRAQLIQMQGQQATVSAEIERLEGEVSRRNIKAPVDGTIGDVSNLRIGSVVREGDRLAVVVPRGSLRIVANFLPPDALGRIKPGQPARLRLEGFPWAQYGSVNATVSSVANEIRDGRIRVELAVDSTANSRIPLQHGLPGTIEVEVERISPAALMLRIASRALTSPQSNSIAKVTGQP